MPSNPAAMPIAPATSKVSPDPPRNRQRKVDRSRSVLTSCAPCVPRGAGARAHLPADDERGLRWCCLKGERLHAVVSRPVLPRVAAQVQVPGRAQQRPVALLRGAPRKPG